MPRHAKLTKTKSKNVLEGLHGEVALAARERIAIPESVFHVLASSLKCSLAEMPSPLSAPAPKSPPEKQPTC